MPKYCYGTDEEFYRHTSMGDLIDDVKGKTDTPIGATYWRGEVAELTLEECIDVDSFLEQCDERAYEEIGDMYDNCFTNVSADEKAELNALIVEWAKKRVNMRFWKVINVQELKIEVDDLGGAND